jgi:hypothetical protein
LTYQTLAGKVCLAKIKKLGEGRDRKSDRHLVDTKTLQRQLHLQADLAAESIGAELLRV